MQEHSRRHDFVITNGRPLKETPVAENAVAHFKNGDRCPKECSHNKWGGKQETPGEEVFAEDAHRGAYAEKWSPEFCEKDIRWVTTQNKWRTHTFDNTPKRCFAQTLNR